MFIICKNDFPYSACPVGTSRDCAEGIAQYYQNKCGIQIGLAERTYFYVVEVELETIGPLEMTPEELNTIPVGATGVDAAGRVYRRIKKVKGESNGT